MAVTHRAAPPQAPEPTAELLRAREERRAQHQVNAAFERRRMARGLLLLGLAVLIASVLRAGFGRAFVHGWWRQW